MPKILYIAGSARSGTTLLANLLGQLPEWAASGECHNVWRNGFVYEGSCGCGLKLRECPVWQRAFDVGFGGIDEVDPLRAIGAAASTRIRHIRHIGRVLRAGRIMTDCDYAPYMNGIYAGLAAATGARVIVDSSKTPVDPLVAAGLPDCEVFLVHMVRDPRAVAFSWQRRKLMPDIQDRHRVTRKVNYVRTAVMWQAINMLIGREVRRALGSDRYLRLNYERLAADPKTVVDEILDFAGETSKPCPTFDGNVIDLKPTHTAAGNPSRFITGPTRIEVDAEWRSAMPRRRRLAISALAYPTLRSMGYRWWP